MNRTITVGILTLIIGLSTSATSQACLYIPWLDPFAWLGFYGCGGYGYGCGPQTGYGCGNYGYGGGYAAPQIYAPQPIYAPSVMNYAPAPVAPGCDCVGAMPQQQQAMTAVRVPVTSYRAVTQYVPQTTYRTEYRAVQQNYAMTQPVYGTAGMAYGQYPTTAAYPTSVYPATAYQPYSGYYGSSYNTATLPFQSAYAVPQTAPTYGPTIIQPPMGVASPYGSGDINGDHEYPSQSALAPGLPYPPQQPTIQQASYGVPPRSARTYPSAVR